VLEDWQLIEPIAQGGTSRLFKARHIASGRLAAIKIFDGESRLNLHPLLARSPEQEACFLKELKQENIVEFLEWGLSPRGLYLALEYLPGMSLSQVIERRLKAKVAAASAGRLKGCVGHKELLVVVEQICLALDYLHKHGIVHGDLKPANVIVIPQNKAGRARHLVKLIDFGIARWVDVSLSARQAKSDLANDTVFGSPLYMSPEQCLGLPLDGRADIYSLGCLMYECLVGRQPLCGRDARETMYMHVHASVDVLTLARLSPLSPIVKKCLAKKPGDRYQAVGEILELIRVMKSGRRRRNFKISGKK
jgi:serine/threonine-protein kinase